MTAYLPRMVAPRIVYAGTPEFAVPALRRLLQTGAEIAGVYSQPDRPAGRGRKLTASPVKKVALEHDLPVVQPLSLREEDSQAALAALRPDLMVVAAYGLILPPEVLAIPTFGCWNLHASLLPRWRGAAPIQRAIEAGDERTGLCVMQMEAGLDTGPVLHRLETAIHADDTAGMVHDRLAELGADALAHCLEQAAQGRLAAPERQHEPDALYAPKLTKAEAALDWTEPAAVLERRVRAFNPWPVAWCELDGKRLRVWRASADNTAHEHAPGQILTGEPDRISIATSAGYLHLLEIQPEGRRRMLASDYLNARPAT